MDSTRRAARRAGLLYLLLAVTAPVGLMYVPGQLIVAGDAAATADKIRASEWLLRLGIGSELFHQAVVIFLVLALYRVVVFYLVIWGARKGPAGAAPPAEAR